MNRDTLPKFVNMIIVVEKKLSYIFSFHGHKYITDNLIHNPFHIISLFSSFFFFGGGM